MAFAVVVDELSVVQESGIGRDQSAVTQYICTAQRGSYTADRVQVRVVWYDRQSRAAIGVAMRSLGCRNVYTQSSGA